MELPAALDSITGLIGTLSINYMNSPGNRVTSKDSPVGQSIWKKGGFVQDKCTHQRTGKNTVSCSWDILAVPFCVLSCGH